MCSLLLPPEDRSPALRGVTQTAPICFPSVPSLPDTDLIWTLSGLKSSMAFHCPPRQLVWIIQSVGLVFVFVFLTPKEFVIQWKRQGCVQMSQHMVCLL